MAKILVVDDERSVRTIIKELLDLEGHTVDAAEDGVQALEKFREAGYDLVITDIKMPNMEGDELLSKIRELQNDIAVIMVSGHSSIDKAVECIHKGAFDFISKPVEMNRLLVSVRNSLDKKEQVQEIKTLKRRVTRFGDIIGKSTAIEHVKEMIDKVAPSDARVLITGNNGTGKELVARWLHEKSRRYAAPFIEVNCAAIPSELIESELFGHEKGSFTSAIKLRKGKFEQAETGTIFLDEIGDMSLSAQAKVLRALQEKKISRVGSDKDIDVDVRVVCATNKNLQEEIAEGRFREDLYHRLSVIIINVPPLAERRDDIPLLTDHFIHQVCQEQGINDKKITPEAIDLLKNMAWTGNIRELRNIIERLIILGNDPISVSDVKTYV